MSATWFDRDVADYRAILRPSPDVRRRKGILRRIRAAFVPASQREADRHMARLLRQSNQSLRRNAGDPRAVVTSERGER